MPNSFWIAWISSIPFLAFHFVPLLAFDRTGGRLGQGAGCYDRTIAALRAMGAVRVIGLAYAGQEVVRVPVGVHDQRLDGILTDTGYIEVVHTRP